MTGNQISFAATHTLGDTRRHQVSYAIETTTRYLEHFVQRGKVTFHENQSLPLSSVGIVPGTTIVRSLDGSVAYRPDEDFVVDTQAGTVTRTPLSAIPSDQPVELALVAPPVTKTGNTKVLDLPSTARPATPKVAWIVPTFGWTDQTSGLNRTRTRSGGGLRVFLSGRGSPPARASNSPSSSPPARFPLARSEQPTRPPATHLYRQNSAARRVGFIMPVRDSSSTRRPSDDRGAVGSWWGQRGLAPGSTKSPAIIAGQPANTTLFQGFGSAGTLRNLSRARTAVGAAGGAELSKSISMISSSPSNHPPA